MVEHSKEGHCSCGRHHNDMHDNKVSCDHKQSKDYQVTSAIDMLKKAGLKYTKKRKKMIEVFIIENRYLSARQVQEILSKDYPGLSYDTIYRNLYTYVSLNILEETELNGEKLFRFRCQTHSHHHHFICEKCGRTKEIPICPMDYFENQLKDCQITSHRFEIFGICDYCLSNPTECL